MKMELSCKCKVLTTYQPNARSVRENIDLYLEYSLKGNVCAKIASKIFPVQTKGLIRSLSYDVVWAKLEKTRNQSAF